MMLHKIINPLKETINNFPNVNIKNIKSNSKEVKKDDLFIAVNGNIVDGNNFIDEAIEFGASAIITSNKKCKEDQYLILLLMMLKDSIQSFFKLLWRSIKGIKGYWNYWNQWKNNNSIFNLFNFKKCKSKSCSNWNFGNKR